VERVSPVSSKTPSSDVPGQVQIIDPTIRRLVPMAIEEPTEDLAHLTEVIRQIKTTLEDGNVWADNITQLAFSGSIPNSAGDLSVLSTQVLNNAVTAAQLAQSLAEVAKAFAETASASAQSSSGLAATDATNAGISATAAQQSSVTAGASATNAAQSAAAAQTDALTAQTKAGEASVSAAAAVVSDNSASNAASAATSARDVAVKTYGRGQHPNPVFLDW